MRATDYIREKQRMCQSFNYCCDCPFKDDSFSCNETEKNNPEKAEEIVETWAKENPEITNAVKFKEVFGESAEEVWSLLLPEFNMWLNQKYRGNEVK